MARLQPFFEALAYPRLSWDLYWGHEDYSHPGSSRILALARRPPQILHLHNLHGQWLKREGFFDLQALVSLSRELPTILAPQDPWLLTGHCGHPLGCPRWRVGCGHCPDLAIYPAIRRDGTTFNWRRKRSIYRRAQLYLTTPSHWLMELFEQADIQFTERRVVPNGIDVNQFCPADRSDCSGSPASHQRKVVLVVGNHLRSNPWKGFGWVREAALRLSSRHLGIPVDFVCVGDEAETEQWDNVRLSFIPTVQEPRAMARIYQEADLLLHPSKADTAPFVVLEAMSSGLPVVATAVGGIPEQVEDRGSGFLVVPGDAESMADRIEALLTQDSLRRAMGSRGREIALKRFSLACQVDAYLDWYREILDRRALDTER